ncbi:MAG: outer membrane lipoprotein carrier protein LolA [Thermodesulfovibrionales bacterium]|nr:outer membrane lipoprotein carrier protein LolA [Thermodesulfovibrionales bacterium]
MKPFLYRLLLALSLSVPFLTPGLASQLPDEAIRIQKAYEGIRDMKGSFVQTSHIKDLKKTTVYKGNFLIKRPSKMRWSYEEQEVIINRGDIFIYQKKERQAFKGRFQKEVYGSTPVALLSGFADIGSEFKITVKDGRLLLKPNRPMGGVSMIEIAPAKAVDGFLVPFPIASFKVIDAYSNTVEINLSGVELNTGLKDPEFELSLPEGISIHEYNP